MTYWGASIKANIAAGKPYVVCALWCNKQSNTNVVVVRAQLLKGLPVFWPIVPRIRAMNWFGYKKQCTHPHSRTNEIFSDMHGQTGRAFVLEAPLQTRSAGRNALMYDRKRRMRVASCLAKQPTSVTPNCLRRFFPRSGSDHHYFTSVVRYTFAHTTPFMLPQFSILCNSF